MTEEEKVRRNQVLRAIQMRANRKFGHKLFKTEPPSAEVLFVFDKMLERTDLPKWKRDYYVAMRKQFTSTETVLDEEVAKQQERFIEHEVAHAIKKGLIPKPKYDKSDLQDV